MAGSAALRRSPCRTHRRFIAGRVRRLWATRCGRELGSLRPTDVNRRFMHSREIGPRLAFEVSFLVRET